MRKYRGMPGLKLPRAAWRRSAGYALGMLLEITAVAALCSAALLLMFLVKAILK